MRLVITAEHHFVTTPDGAHWGPDTMTYRFWQRYLDVFDHVSVLARVRRVSVAGPEHSRLDGASVSVHALPEYVGPREYLKVRRAMMQSVDETITPQDAVLMRVGCSPLAAMVESRLEKRQQLYGAEVITDPYMVFARGAIRHPLRPFFRQMFTRQLVRQCANATAATYVTQFALQERYPPGSQTYSTSFSDVDLPPEAFVAQPRSGELHGSTPTIVSIGSMAQMYKGFDVLIEAVARSAQRGVVANVVLVGDGKHRAELEHQVRSAGLQQLFTFTGQLAGGAAVREQLDRADVFVLASRTEGLPRVLIEAQARGLPCIGTRVGGIPELLDSGRLVNPGDPEDLTAKIMALLVDTDRRALDSERNLTRAQNYSESELNARRQAFLRELRDRTADQAHRTIGSPDRPDGSFALFQGIAGRRARVNQ